MYGIHSEHISKVMDLYNIPSKVKKLLVISLDDNVAANQALLLPNDFIYNLPTSEDNFLQLASLMKSKERLVNEKIQIYFANYFFSLLRQHSLIIGSARTTTFNNSTTYKDWLENDITRSSVLDTV